MHRYPIQRQDAYAQHCDDRSAAAQHMRAQIKPRRPLLRSALSIRARGAAAAIRPACARAARPNKTSRARRRFNLTNSSYIRLIACMVVLHLSQPASTS